MRFVCRLLVAALLAGTVVTATANPASAAPCDPPVASAIACENTQPGQPAERVGRQPGRATRRSRASPPTSASTGRDGPLQGRHRRQRLPHRHLPARLLRRQRRAEGRDGHAARRAAADPAGLPHRRRRPASSTAATGPCRPRGRSRPTPSRASTSPSSYARRHRRRQPHRLRRPRRREPLRRPLPDLGHDLAGLQQLRRQQPLRRRARPGRGLQGQLQPPVHHARRRRRRTSLFDAEYPMVRWLEAQRLRRQLHHGRRHRPRAATLLTEAQGVPVGRPRRVLVGRAARQRRGGARRRREPRRSSAATRSSGRRAGSRASTAPARRYRTLVSYKETHANAKIDPTADVDRHLARPALQPAGRRRPARERAHRHHLHGQRRAATTRSRCPPADGKMRFWRNTTRRHAGRGADRDAADRDARLRVGRGPRQRVPPAGPGPALDDDRRPSPSTSLDYGIDATAPGRRRTT